jgi:sugar transferase EpsL
VLSECCEGIIWEAWSPVSRTAGAAGTQLRTEDLHGKAVSAFCKRALDFTIAAAMLILLSPLLVVIALAIRITMGRPVFFRQIRPGYHGRPFTVVKFRTMTGDGSHADPSLDATRLTRLGAVLRPFSLDELPQLWNVLKGDMSLVGPRPLMMQYLERYSPEQARRQDVLPGITGWAQINGRNAVSWEEKFHLDVWYVDHQSFLLDLRILAATIWRVLKQEGVSQQGHATMPEFMGTKGSNLKSASR